MTTADTPLILFLKDILRRQKLLPSQLAKKLGVSHVTVIRWFSGKGKISTNSCQKLAKQTGEPLEYILALTGHIPSLRETVPEHLPTFRQYMLTKYPGVIDGDLLDVIENLIEIKLKARKEEEALHSGGCQGRYT